MLRTEKTPVIVSNRLPLSIEDGDEGPRLVPASGGLVTALGPALRERGGRWIGWLGESPTPELEASLADCKRDLGYEISAVDLEPEEVEGYYNGLSNEVLWPLFHDFVGHCNFVPSYWPVYQQVNRKFAKAIVADVEHGDYIWVHDYHLLLVGRELRAMGEARQIGFFLHIPFPSPDLFQKLPWCRQVLDGMLHYDLIGFQTRRDLANFIQCAKRQVTGFLIEDGATADEATIAFGEVRVRVGVFPISIDYQDFLARSVENPVSELVARTRARLAGRTLILGLDRLDYTKGIPERIKAYGNALERYPELNGRVTLIQVVVPSRTLVGDYQDLKDEIDRLIGTVNGAHTRAGWSPIHYVFRHLPQTELLAYYRACDIALVTPLKDGMNLVCKEYCACSLEGNGVLILSEFAGAASQLTDGALLVNPFDLEAVADAIHQAVTMPDEERMGRMQRLRGVVAHNDVYRWVGDFLSAAAQPRAALPRAKVSNG